jgi:hypothetical protein
VQTRDLLVVFNEDQVVGYRQVFLDGRGLHPIGAQKRDSDSREVAASACPLAFFYTAP